MDKASQKVTMGEAAIQFLASLPPEERKAKQEVYRFVRWYGAERPFSELTAPGAANYAERLSTCDADAAKKLAFLRAFLTYAWKQKWSTTNLATHLKLKKSRSGVLAASGKGPVESVSLTQEGYAELEAEVAVLQGKRDKTVKEMTRAAADKDFRENAPLAAAREEKSHLDGRIKEIEETLKSAVVISGVTRVVHKVSIGDTVVLSDRDSGEESRYTIVSPREVDPSRGKISCVSPLGKAILGQFEGRVIEVRAPAGTLLYLLKHIEH